MQTCNSDVTPNVISSWSKITLIPNKSFERLDILAWISFPKYKSPDKIEYLRITLPDKELNHFLINQKLHHVWYDKRNSYAIIEFSAVALF